MTFAAWIPHDTVCNINSFEWWNGLSNCYFLQLGSHPWKHSSVAETGICVLLFSSCVNMDLQPELLSYMVSLDYLMMTLLRLSSAVRQKRACSLPWGRKPSQAKLGPDGECPQPAVSGLVMLLLPCSVHFSSVPFLLIWYLHHNLLAAVVASYQTVELSHCYKYICFLWWGDEKHPEGVGVYSQAVIVSFTNHL